MYEQLHYKGECLLHSLTPFIYQLLKFNLFYNLHASNYHGIELSLTVFNKALVKREKKVMSHNIYVPLIRTRSTYILKVHLI